MTDSIQEGRILAIDYGKKRVGLALSDPLGCFATALETLANHPERDVIPELAAICKAYDVSRILLGLPLNLKGEEALAAQEVTAFGDRLHASLALPIIYLDERFTSKIAAATLRELGISASRKRKTGIIDQLAAMRLLQDYLDRRKR